MPATGVAATHSEEGPGTTCHRVQWALHSGARQGMSGPAALSCHGEDSSSEEPRGAGHLRRPGQAGAVSSEADKASGEKPGFTLFLAGFTAW